MVRQHSSNINKQLLPFQQRKSQRTFLMMALSSSTLASASDYMFFESSPSSSSLGCGSSSSSNNNRPQQPFAQNKHPRRGTVRRDASLLVEWDTLPDFPTVPGMLSPETVMRMSSASFREQEENQALATFFDTYRRQGPLACLPMLSDPDILPVLTEAMRGI
eukprot:CAMPEP_0118691016 /NCGR_PEP_ID=MMETSP0800-20121206/10440_1 /TAXON_ID=210618 ORGANISM="Striatella unipunctata, Strain CCMP2910" /NCGR_SAMPLE_ID=MMETSP0800 /ASSEMBLY_ACC=CAM_ASM_000638 /LENGTH=161 /DNA_ID=CAMNT_0006588737 /DNA_START=84 /DNA_END=569 /DNA_ORIENTATION=+